MKTPITPSLSRIDDINEKLSNPMLTSVERMSLCLEKFNLILSQGRNMLNQNGQATKLKPGVSANRGLPVTKGASLVQ